MAFIPDQAQHDLDEGAGRLSIPAACPPGANCPGWVAVVDHRDQHRRGGGAGRGDRRSVPPGRGDQPRHGGPDDAPGQQPCGRRCRAPQRRRSQHTTAIAERQATSIAASPPTGRPSRRRLPGLSIFKRPASCRPRPRRLEDARTGASSRHRRAHRPSRRLRRQCRYTCCRGRSGVGLAAAHWARARSARDRSGAGAGRLVLVLAESGAPAAGRAATGASRM